jgi:hypothetical protein
MKTLIVTTETGSVYRITEKTWEKISITEKSGPTRTSSGDIFNKMEPIVGQSMFIITNPLENSKDTVLLTSHVLSIEEEQK